MQQRKQPMMFNIFKDIIFSIIRRKISISYISMGFQMVLKHEKDKLTVTNNSDQFDFDIWFRYELKYL